MANKKNVKKSKSKVVNSSKKNDNDKVFNYIFFDSVFSVIAGILIIMAFIVLKIANSDFIKAPTVMTYEVSYLESELISCQEVGYNSLVADADSSGNPLSLLIDGACIINSNEFVYSFGAIIQNDSGSTGGGRGSAAKKLLSNGMTIKISTDGYIEVYLEQRKIYVIKY